MLILKMVFFDIVRLFIEPPLIKIIAVIAIFALIIRIAINYFRGYMTKK